VIQFVKFQDHQRQQSETNFCIVGKPEVITAPLTVLAEQRCRRKAIHSGDSAVPKSRSIAW